MKVGHFLQHHGIVRNPFAEEDAQTDKVFKDHCLEGTFHPAWDKVYGEPAEPSTSIVFGEKGAGKTAMRLQMAEHLRRHNAQHPATQVYVIAYDDFNPFLDRFRARLGRPRWRADKVLAQWRLWDHMDAILALGVTHLVDLCLDPASAASTLHHLDAGHLQRLGRHQARDLLLLAAYYDESTAQTFRGRFQRLRRKLRYHCLRTYWPFAAGVVLTLLLSALWAWLAVQYGRPFRTLGGFGVLLAGLVASWLPWGWRFGQRTWQAYGVRRSVRTSNRDLNSLRFALSHFAPAELAGQPCPNKESTDDRYELLMKLQGLLQTLGFPGILVLVDRVDEPHLINGSAELMKRLIWPMLDNKFLKHPGLGLKMMLPIELTRYIQGEEREFFQRSRLDKQNVIASFEWTGEALYDLTNARLAACSAPGRQASVSDLFESAVTEQRLIEAFRSLRVPRRLFKFLYHLMVEHCNAHTDREPIWQIDARLFETSLAGFLRYQEAYDRGLGTI